MTPERASDKALDILPQLLRFVKESAESQNVPIELSATFLNGFSAWAQFNVGVLFGSG